MRETGRNKSQKWKADSRRNGRYVTPMLALSLSLTIIVAVAGCQTSQYVQAVKDDLRDAVRVSAGIGLGCHADAKVTSLFHPGFGWAGIWYSAGLPDRYTPLLFPSQEFCLFPVIAATAPFALPRDKWYLSESLRLANGILTEREETGEELCVGGAVFDFAGFRQWGAYGQRKVVKHPTLFQGHPESFYTEKPMGVEFGLGLLLVNIRVGFDIVEFIDFVTTCCGVDILYDNEKRAKPADASPERTGTEVVPPPAR